jgi:hypothetical protein
MELTLGLILDELAPYKPVVHKMRNTEVEFRQFHYYDCKSTETDPRCLYVLAGTERGVGLSEKSPAHVSVAGEVPGALVDKTDAFDTLIQIPGGLSAVALFLIPANHGITPCS